MLRPLVTLLALSNLPGIGRERLYEFFTETGLNIRALNGYCHAWHLPALASQFPRAYERAEQHLTDVQAAGVQVTGWTEPGYPAMLLNDNYPPPPILYYTGTPVAPGEQAVAIVGTRRASPAGLEFAREVARDLAQAGLTVVSGLALGIDGSAHRGALDVPGGRTIAVLGSGHHRIHPAAHRGLAERMVEAGGAVYSLWPPEVTAERYTFIERNSVITGLAKIVAIIEAGSPSGALNSASHALRQNRETFVMPGRPNDPRVRGSLELLADGFPILFSAQDILAKFALQLQAVDTRYQYEVSTVLSEHGALTLDGLQEHCELALPELLEQLTYAELSGEVRRGVDGTYSARKGGATLER